MQRTKTNILLQNGWKQILCCQIIAQSALNEFCRGTIDHVVGGGNVEIPDLRICPMGNQLLEACPSVKDQRDPWEIRLFDEISARQRTVSGHQKSPPGGFRQRNIIVFRDINRLQENRKIKASVLQTLENINRIAAVKLKMHVRIL